jgi:hypothetical protein
MSPLIKCDEINYSFPLFFFSHISSTFLMRLLSTLVQKSLMLLDIIEIVGIYPPSPQHLLNVHYLAG